MADKKERVVRDRHHSKITQGSDGRWKTHVVTPDGKRKLMAKSRKEDLIEALYCFYVGIDGDRDLTFAEAWQKFRDYKADDLVSDNTIYKMDHDLIRFFGDTDFAARKIRDISEEDCRSFIVKTIKTLQLRKKAFEALFGYIKGVLKYARNRKYIDENPMDYLERREFSKYCFVPKVDVSKRIVSDDELTQIKDRLEFDHTHRPKFITGYAVELAQLIGMRVGEIAALKWDCVDFDNHVITVDKAEVCHQKDNSYSIERTKNGSVRAVPMTQAVEDLLCRVREVEERNGYLCDFVFANRKGRIHKTAISHCALNKSHQAGLEHGKCIHSYRRTLNSKMRTMGVSATAAAAILGHTAAVNESNYTYDVSDIDEKRRLLEQAQAV